MEQETVVVATNNPFCSAFDVVPPEGDVLAVMARAEAFYREGEPESLPIQAMTWDQFFTWKRERMQARAVLEEITEEEWWRALEELPPLHWHVADGVERFLCLEAMNGSWHTQYAKLGGRYLSRLVDRHDKTTWITREDF